MAYSEAVDCTEAPQSSVDAIRDALASAASLTDRILQMRGRLVGHVPMAVGSAGGESNESLALFPQLERQALRTAEQVREAHEHLSAIDRATGL